MTSPHAAAIAAGFPPGDEDCCLLAPPLGLTFHWVDDRWTHWLAVGPAVVVSAVEWDVDLSDPTRVVSPAIQQLASEVGPKGPRALGVGQWGRHHFSGVYTLTTAEDGCVMAEADIAVRTRAPLVSLAATYSVRLAPGDLVDAGPDAAAWRVDGPVAGTLRLEPGPAAQAGPARLTLAESGRCETRVQVLSTVVDGASVHRLFYRWCWSPAR